MLIAVCCKNFRVIVFEYYLAEIFRVYCAVSEYCIRSETMLTADVEPAVGSVAYSCTVTGLFTCHWLLEADGCIH